MAGVAECFSYFGPNLGLSDKFVKYNTDRPDVGISIALLTKFVCVFFDVALYRYYDFIM